LILPAGLFSFSGLKEKEIVRAINGKVRIKKTRIIRLYFFSKKNQKTRRKILMITKAGKRNPRKA
jgi:hypothetical protein